jgi:hypothetical protein
LDPCLAADDGRLDEEGRANLGDDDVVFLDRGLIRTCADASASPKVHRGDVLGGGSGPLHGCIFLFASKLSPLRFASVLGVDDETSFVCFISRVATSAATAELYVAVEDTDPQLVLSSDGDGLVASLLIQVAR